MENRPQQDPTLWARLPPELLEKVLGKLPLLQLLSYRAVCTQWKAMIDSPRVTYEGPSMKPLIFYHHPGGVLSGEVYWSRPFLAFPNMSSSIWERYTLPFTASRNVLVATDEGLLCFSTKNSPDQFVIYNPLSRRWRGLRLPSPVLPKLPRGLGSYEAGFLYELVGLVVNQKTGNYQLVVAGIHEDGPRETQLYDSASDSWRTSTPVPPMPTALGSDGEWNADRGFCCGGNLYWHVFETNNDGAHVKGLLKFDVQLESWTLVQQSVAVEDPSQFHIAPYEGKVLLLDWNEREYTENNVTLAATELQKLGPEIKLMDNRLIDVVDANEALIPIRTIGHGAHLYIVLHSNRPDDLKLRVLEYNSSTWLPIWGSIRDENLWAFAPTLRAYA